MLACCAAAAAETAPQQPPDDAAQPAPAATGALLQSPFAGAAGLPVEAQSAQQQLQQHPPGQAPGAQPPGFGPPPQQQEQGSGAPMAASPFAAMAQAPQPQLTASSSLEQLLAGRPTPVLLCLCCMRRCVVLRK